MNLETQKDFTLKEQVDYLINITHDEFLENVIEGREEDYQEWAEFCAQCVAKLIVPEQRDGK